MKYNLNVMKYSRVQIKYDRVQPNSTNSEQVSFLIGNVLVNLAKSLNIGESRPELVNAGCHLEVIYLEPSCGG